MYVCMYVCMCVWYVNFKISLLVDTVQSWPLIGRHVKGDLADSSAVLEHSNLKLVHVHKMAADTGYCLLRLQEIWLMVYVDRCCYRAPLLHADFASSRQ